MSADHPRRIVLDDQRILAFDEHGDPEGAPVFSFHGGISSRLDATPLAGAARDSGVRLIAPDRPGTGYSDSAPGRTLLDWPGDVVALADSLGIGRFAVMGWSLGGQYAAACAYALPRRVTRAAILAGVVPFEAGGGRRGLSFMDRSLLTLSRWAPPLAWISLRLGISARSAERLQGTLERHSPAADRRAMREDDPPTATAEAIKHALRAGTRGAIGDYRIWRRPWGFSLDAVHVEVGIWQGDADTMVTVADAEALTELIPHARLALREDEGHVSLQRNYAREYLTWLAQPHSTNHE
jgi:pimeloyl-ACP methyl ester carboxylesterase